MLHEVNIVKYRRSDFLAADEASIPVDFDLTDLDETQFVNTPVKALESCHIDGILHFDGRSRVISHLHYTGVMIVEDSITGEDLEYDFETESEKEYSFDPIDRDDPDENSDDEDVIVVARDTIDLHDETIEAIVYEAPMSITRLAREDYPKGSSWVLISDQDEQKESEEADPRWAKLKDFNFEDN